MTPVPRIRESAVMVPVTLAAIFGVLFFYATQGSQGSQPTQVPRPVDPVRFKAAQEIAVRDLLPDPESVRFRKNTVAADGPVVCGEINVRNSVNAYTGFRRFISGKDFPSKDFAKIEQAGLPEDPRPEYAASREEMDRLWQLYCVHAK